MDSIKLFRFTIPGGIFLIAILLTYVIFGGSFCEIDAFGSRNVYALVISITGIIITLFFTSSIIGFMISTIGHFIIYYIYGYKLYFKIPNPIITRNEFNAFFNYLTKDESDNENITNLKTSFIDYYNKNKLMRFFSRKEYKELFYYYQLVVREKMSKEFIYFSERRWSMFRTQYNNFISIIFGSFLGYYLSEIIPVINGYKPSNSIVVFLLIFHIIYTIITIWQICSIRGSTLVIEQYWSIHKGKNNTPHNNGSKTSGQKVVK